MAETSACSVEIEVRYAETDAMGIVHHANYLVWFELARTRLCGLTGRHYAQIEAGGHRLTVTGANVRYRRPARYGDQIDVSVRIGRLGSRGLRFDYEVRRSSDLLATGTTEHVWIDHSGRPCRIPAELAPEFAALAATD